MYCSFQACIKISNSNIVIIIKRDQYNISFTFNLNQEMLPVGLQVLTELAGVSTMDEGNISVQV